VRVSVKEIFEHYKLLLCESLAGATRNGGIGIAETNSVLRCSTRERRGEGVVVIMMIHGKDLEEERMENWEKPSRTYLCNMSYVF